MINWSRKLAVGLPSVMQKWKVFGRQAAGLGEPGGLENEREGEVKVTLEVFSLVDSEGSGAPHEMGPRNEKVGLEDCCIFLSCVASAL